MACRVYGCAVAVAALIVAIVSALAAVGAVVYGRRLDRTAQRAVAEASRSAAAAERSAVASEKSTALKASRRHDELMPRFRVSLGQPDPGHPVSWMLVSLLGPPELGRLDALTVRIRDDYPGREIGPLPPSGPTREQVEAQVWGLTGSAPVRVRGSHQTGAFAGPIRRGARCRLGGVRW